MRIYGVHPVEELLKTAPGSVSALYYTSREVDQFQEALELAGTHGIQCQAIDHQKLDKMSEGGNHQGILAQTVGFEYVTADDLIDATSEASQAGILVLDQVQDPRNLGAMIRSAAGMGFDGVVIPKDRAAPVTPTVVRTSAGCAFRIPIARVTNISRTLELLKDGGYWIVGSRMAEAEPAWEIDFDMKAGLVLGGEHKGMRRLVAETCDLYAKIPLAAGIDSLNVASAATALMYEVRRQQSG